MKKVLKKVIYTPLFLAAGYFVFPLYWMVSGSFKPQRDLMNIPPKLLPIPFVLEHYTELFADKIIFRWLFNSILISILTTFFVVIFSSMSGYSFAKKKFWGRDIIFGIMLVTLMIPRQVLLIPMFSIIGKLNMFDTYQGMIFPSIGWPFGVFMMRQFCKTIPLEMMEAAKMDGSGEIRTFSQIIFPLLKPAIGAITIFTFIDTWNDYMWQLLVLKSKNMYTLSLGIASLKMRFDINYGQLMAGAVIAAIPMVLFFVAFQKYFSKGITMGAIKG